ncbi:hypothetical protein BCR37DRAFT_393157 [Protomyces lactucae-debilis]|uniref:Uncharacterized protein n=1 Tax=Protomyces lactucae-debilis TaxID=2754530 RepID=A0A1Y2FDW9_PROLT|nr:uncharacterized protein BCR37DRAFT_393157 [Protomyces lactucae-debilis]ORY82121.1 hypothetical protein BCR37DRAFT_393157 [Protomyces lactucae-debilis]
MNDQERALDAMVNADAEPLNVDASYAYQTCCISTHGPNRILILNAPGVLRNMLVSAVKTSYRKGISKEVGQQEVILHGRPFFPFGQDLQDGVRITYALIRCMIQCGWDITTDINLSWRTFDVATLYFHKSESSDSKSRQHVVVCAIDLVDLNGIQVIDAPVALVNLVKTVIQQRWTAGHTYSLAQGTPEFRLKGFAFESASSSQLAGSRMLLGTLLSRLRQDGYKLITTCNTKATEHGQLSTLIIQCPTSALEPSEQPDAKSQRPGTFADYTDAD